MKRKIVLLIMLVFVLTSCSSIAGYDYTSDEVNTNLFYQNIADVKNAADPFVITVGDTFYMYATNANDQGDCSYLQVWESKNLTDWTNKGICYQPKRTNWAIDGLWAPEVIFKDGTYYLYYSGWDIKRGGHQIGVAVSDNPLGPFEDFVGDTANGYMDGSVAPIRFDFPVIDASPFIDEDGSAYLLFTKDQVNGVSSSYIARLNSDMATIDKSSITLLIEPSLDWEKESTTSFWNEGPFLYKHEGKYYLFYSANYYMSRSYCIGVAVSDNPFGPFVKQEDPVMMTQYSWDYVSGTGHCSLFKSPDGKEVFMAYHSHLDTLLGGAERIINFDRVNFVDGKVIVNGPSISPQILPSGVGEYRDLKDEMQVLVNGVPIYQLYDGIINVFEDELDNEVNLMMNKVKITIVFNEVKTIRGIMIYDSANCDYSLKSIDSIVINNKKIKNLKINDKYFSDDDYLYKIPVSSFIYEFDEITTNKIEINISSDDVIYLNEIKVIGKQL